MTDIDALRRAGEGQHVEFKTGFGEQGEIIDTLVAFANAFGGTVLVGVKDPEPHEVVGVSLGSNTLEQFDGRLKEKAGLLPGFESEVIPHGERTVVQFTVRAHAPGQLLMSGGCAIVRAARSNQRMTVEQVRARILEDPTVASGRPLFVVGSGSTSNPKEGTQAEIARTVELVDGDRVESVEWQFRGTHVTPREEWERARVSGQPPKAQLRRSIDKQAPTKDDDEVLGAEFAILIRFLWRNEHWYELHRFPMQGSADIRGEIFPSYYRRGEGDWVPSS